MCAYIYVHTHRHPYLHGDFSTGFQGISLHNPIEFQWDLSGKLPEDCFVTITYLSCLSFGELLLEHLNQSRDQKSKADLLNADNQLLIRKVIAG